MKRQKKNYLVQRLGLILLCFLALFQTPALAASFTDVAQGHWAYLDIEKAYEDGVIQGAYYNKAMGSRYFQPDSRLTTAQFLTIIGRAFYDRDMREFASRAQNWYDPAWELAMKYHFIDSQSGKEKLQKEISRYEMAEILYWIFEEFQVKFPDEAELRKTQAKIADFSEIKERKTERYITPIFYFGVLSGVDEKGTFAGDRFFTRAEMAVIYTRLNSFLADAIQNRKLRDFRAGVLSLVNAERAKRGIALLEMDDQLNRAAQVRAGELLKLFEHTRLDGRDALSILDDMGIRFYAAGENIASGQTGPETVVEDWMSSMGHRENILSEEFSRIGIGYLDDAWVQLFAD